MDNNTIVKPYFENIQKEIIKQLSLAQSSIYVAVAWITDVKILAVLNEKARKGLDVKVLVANHKFNKEASFLSLVNAGVEVAIFGERRDYAELMHNKFCIIDKRVTISGSYNWSVNAQSNLENISVIEGRDIAIRFLEEFNKIIKKHHQKPSFISSIWERFQPAINIIQGIKSPEILFFKSNRRELTFSNPIKFEWSIGGEFTDVYLNSKNVTNLRQITISETTEKIFILKVINRNWAANREKFEVSSKPIYIEISSKPAVIQEFSASAKFVKNGDSIELSWEVKKAINVELVGHRRVELSDTISLTPTKDTTYRLRAKSVNGAFVESTIFVEVDKSAPEIINFRADRYFLEDAIPLTLQWNVKNAKSVSINELGSFAPVGNLKDAPRRDTTYQLIAISHYGVVSTKKNLIEVSKAAPNIIDFSSDLDLLMDASPATLIWSVENYEKLYIEAGNKEVTHLDSLQVHHLEDTTYTLKAVSYFGVETEKSLLIRINKIPPSIRHFNSDKEFVLNDYTVTLDWEIEGAQGVVLNKIGNVNAMDERTIQIHGDTIFKLIATNFFGYKRERQITIRVIPIPLIEKLIVPDIEVNLTTNLEYTPRSANIEIPATNFSGALIELDENYLSSTSKVTNSPDEKASVQGFANYLKQESGQLWNTIKNLQNK